MGWAQYAVNYGYALFATVRVHMILLKTERLKRREERSVKTFVCLDVKIIPGLNDN